MANWANSTYLDLTGQGLTTAATPEAAFGLGPAFATGGTINVALVLNRANDPTALLNEDWATRERTLSALGAAGTLGSTFGADPAAYQSVRDTLGGMGIRLLGAADGYVSSAESRTIWVSLSSSQFADLFGTPLETALTTEARGKLPAGTAVTYWDGALQPTHGLASLLDGMWTGISTEPVPTSEAAGTTLRDGPQGAGNASTTRNTLFPNQIAAAYDFPLTAGTDKTPAVGLLEPGIGTRVPSGDIGSLVQAYREEAGVRGTGTVTKGPVETVPTTASSSERSLDVGVVAAAAPNSDMVLYSGNGGVFAALQEAVWDDVNRIGDLSSSFTSNARPTPDSPFYAAFDGLFVDAALRNISVFMPSGDGGSSAELGTGVPTSGVTADSRWAVVVGGTSMSSLGAATRDTTLAALTAHALAGDPAILRDLVAGGLTTLPGSATSITDFIETTWNQYVFAAGSGTLTSSYLENEAGGGGVDVTRPEPAYQLQYGIDIRSLSFDGQQVGRGVPDVAALAGGNTGYRVPAGDMTGLHGEGGTSASTPLWAALMAQIGAVFQDQGLPLPGYSNDLIYTAAAVAPASFNDVAIGSNTSSFVYGGDVTADYMTGPDGNKLSASTAVTPTGLGYSARFGYDLTTGLGTPNGTVLARAMVQIAQAQMHSQAPSVTDATGALAGATGALLIQTHLRAAGMVSVAGHAADVVPGSSFAWDDRLSGQAVQPGFDPKLVGAFDMAAQGTVGELSVQSGQALDVRVNGTATHADRQLLTSPYGFVSYSDDSGDTVTLARPVAIAQTAGGADNQEAIVRVRDNGVDAHTMTFYRADDLSGRVDGILPGQPGYAAAAFSHAYGTPDGTIGLATPANGQQASFTLTGINNGDIVAAELTDGARQFWGFVNQNERTAAGAPIDRLYNYGMNSWGFEDGIGGGDHDFNDVVFQVDFTSKAGHGLLATGIPFAGT